MNLKIKNKEVIPQKFHQLHKKNTFATMIFPTKNYLEKIIRINRSDEFSIPLNIYLIIFSIKEKLRLWDDIYI